MQALTFFPIGPKTCIVNSKFKYSHGQLEQNKSSWTNLITSILDQTTIYVYYIYCFVDSSMMLILCRGTCVLQQGTRKAFMEIENYLQQY